MADNFAYAGIDIGGTNIKYGLVDPKGRIIHKEQRPTMVEKGAEPLMHLVTNIAESLLFQAAEEELEVRWLGVGTPGAVDSNSGVVVGPSPNIGGWQGMKIREILQDRINMPVYVDNDVNCVGLAESRFGAAVGYPSAVCLAIGTGIGGAILFDGKLWRGATHTAGEIGHVVIDPEGPKCGCGNNGCLEAICSSSAILTRTRKKLKGGLTTVFADVLDGDIENLNVKKLFAAVRKGDEVAREVINETAELLGIGLAGVVNLLNPHIVVIGGGIADGGGGFIEAVTAEIRKRAFDTAVESLRIAKAALGNDAGFIGAGILGDDK
ncbi:MAG: ROK family protein [candidate division Zixibacteria bacterium]|nr:ROK family protein [candidate division Zixibacteria bacterium]